MLSFGKFLIEMQTELWGDTEEHPDLFNIQHDPETGIITHTYINPELQVSRKIYVRGNEAYTGWGNVGIDGTIQSSDNPQTNIPTALKIAKLDATFEHLADFAKRHPHIEKIQYQTTDTEAGRRSRNRIQTYWPLYQEKHNIDTPMVGVAENPFAELYPPLV